MQKMANYTIGKLIIIDEGAADTQGPMEEARV
jgi:hypothetical protein